MTNREHKYFNSQLIILNVYLINLRGLISVEYKINGNLTRKD